jgi:hypothetical protein
MCDHISIMQTPLLICRSDRASRVAFFSSFVTECLREMLSLLAVAAFITAMSGALIAFH